MSNLFERGALNPEWHLATPVHDWRNHVPGHIKQMWSRIPYEVQLALVEWAESLASKEEWD